MASADAKSSAAAAAAANVKSATAVVAGSFEDFFRSVVASSLNPRNDIVKQITNDLLIATAREKETAVIAMFGALDLDPNTHTYVQLFTAICSRPHANRTPDMHALCAEWSTLCSMATNIKVGHMVGDQLRETDKVLARVSLKQPLSETPRLMLAVAQNKLNLPLLGWASPDLAELSAKAVVADKVFQLSKQQCRMYIEALRQHRDHVSHFGAAENIHQPQINLEKEVTSKTQFEFKRLPFAAPARGDAVYKRRATFDAARTSVDVLRKQPANTHQTPEFVAAFNRTSAEIQQQCDRCSREFVQLNRKVEEMIVAYGRVATETRLRNAVLDRMEYEINALTAAMHVVCHTQTPRTLQSDIATVLPTLRTMTDAVLGEPQVNQLPADVDRVWSEALAAYVMLDDATRLIAIINAVGAKHPVVAELTDADRFVSASKYSAEKRKQLQEAVSVPITAVQLKPALQAFQTLTEKVISAWNTFWTDTVPRDRKRLTDNVHTTHSGVLQLYYQQSDGRRAAQCSQAWFNRYNSIEQVRKSIHTLVPQVDGGHITINDCAETIWNTRLFNISTDHVVRASLVLYAYCQT